METCHKCLQQDQSHDLSVIFFICSLTKQISHQTLHTCTCTHEKNGDLSMLQDSSLMRVADVSVQLGPGATRCDEAGTSSMQN